MFTLQKKDIIFTKYVRHVVSIPSMEYLSEFIFFLQKQLIYQIRWIILEILSTNMKAVPKIDY